MLSASALGLADNTYLDLDYSAYHKNLIHAIIIVSYHSMQIFLSFHWLRAHHVACK